MPASRIFWLNAQDVNCTAAVGVQHKSVVRAASTYRHAQCVCDQAGGLRGVDRPPDDHPGERVEHDSAVQLAFPGGVFGDVGHPQLVRALAPEDAPNKIQRRRFVNLRAPGQSSVWGAVEPEITHDPGDLIVTREDASAVAQFRLDPVGTVGAARLAVNVGDLTRQPDPPQLPIRGRTHTPCVVARLAHAECCACVANIEPLPGQGVDHRVEPFGETPSLKNTSTTFRDTASSVSS